MINEFFIRHKGSYADLKNTIIIHWRNKFIQHLIKYYTSVIVLRHVPGRDTKNVVVRLVKDYFGLVVNEHFLKKSRAFVPVKQCQHFAISLKVDYLRVLLLMDGRISLYQVYSRLYYHINQIYIYTYTNNIIVWLFVTLLINEC